MAYSFEKTMMDMIESLEEMRDKQSEELKFYSKWNSNVVKFPYIIAGFSTSDIVLAYLNTQINPASSSGRRERFQALRTDVKSFRSLIDGKSAEEIRKLESKIINSNKIGSPEFVERFMSCTPFAEGQGRSLEKLATYYYKYGFKNGFYLVIRSVAALRTDIVAGDVPKEVLYYKNEYKNLEIVYDKIKKHYAKLVEMDDMRKRNLNIKIEKYKSFYEAYVRLMKTDGIISLEKANNLLKTIPDDDTDEHIRIDFMALVILHNDKYCKDINKEYSDLYNSPEAMLARFLEKNGISSSDINISQIKEKNITRFEEMYSLLASFISDRTVLIYALLVGDLDHIKYIHELVVNRGVLTSETIGNYCHLLKGDSVEFSQLQNNLKILDGTLINPASFALCPEVLVENNNLKENLGVTNTYGISLGGKQGENISYSFLANPRLQDLLDRLIELGLEDYFAEDLNFLNECEKYYDRLDRIRVSREIDMPDSKEEILKLLRRNSFWIPDEKLSDYLVADAGTPSLDLDGADTQKDRQEFIAALKDFRKSDNSNTCVLGDGTICFSYQKIMRQYKKYSTLKETLYWAMVQNCRLSIDELEMIERELTAREKAYM